MRKNKIIAYLFTILMTLGFVLNVSASTPSASDLSYKVIDRDITEIYGGMKDGKITVYKKALYNSNGTIQSYVYATEPQKTTIEGNETVRQIRPASDYGYTYLMLNGFPNKSFGYGDNGDYYVTQLAVWMYVYKVYGYKADDKIVGYLIDTNGEKSFNFTGSYSDANRQTKIANSAYNLYKAALNAHNQGKPTKTYKLSHTISTTDMSIVNGKLQSKPITVSLDGASEYSVSFNLKNVVAVSEETGREKTTFRVAEKFMVRYNGGTGDFNVKVTITAKDPNAVVYEVYPNGDKTATISTFLDSDGSNLSDEFYLRFQANRTTISKQDASTSRELPGATLVIRDLHDRQVATWVTTTEPHYIVLDPGTYTLEETIAPKGYAKQTKAIQFTVKGDGTDKVTMLNQPLTGVDISNKDSSGTDELAGATLVIRDNENHEVATWVSTTEPYHIVLDPGTYTLEETVAPLEYELNTKKVTFTVNADGSVDNPVIMTNELKPIEVPITGSVRSVLIVLLSLVLVVCGTLIFYDGYRKKQLNN